jgi:pyridoxine 4-dehydrogenase
MILARRNEMIERISFAGSFKLPGTSMTLNRMGYGAMQLAGPEVWGTATGR